MNGAKKNVPSVPSNASYARLQGIVNRLVDNNETMLRRQQKLTETIEILTKKTQQFEKCLTKLGRKEERPKPEPTNKVKRSRRSIKTGIASEFPLLTKQSVLDMQQKMSDPEFAQEVESYAIRSLTRECVNKPMDFLRWFNLEGMTVYKKEISWDHCPIMLALERALEKNIHSTRLDFQRMVQFTIAQAQKNLRLQNRSTSPTQVKPPRKRTRRDSEVEMTEEDSEDDEEDEDIYEQNEQQETEDEESEEEEEHFEEQIDTEADLSDRMDDIIVEPADPLTIFLVCKEEPGDYLKAEF